ncbi:MAG: hypothetical protein WC091_05135 [Sulfuricellaceae bacterium]
MRLLLRIWVLALGLLALPAVAASPTTFQPVVGGGLLCRDQIDHVYFTDYLIQAFKAPYKTEGEAYWFKPDNGQKLFGLELTDIFVSVDGSRYAFLGVILKEKLEDAAKKLLELRGLRFEPYAPMGEVAGPHVLRSPEGAFLIRYDTTHSKLYCAKHRIDPWRGEATPPNWWWDAHGFWRYVPRYQLPLTPPSP